ncbi:MAG: DegV family protein, partial [Lachnospiraceae bacterium]
MGKIAVVTDSNSGITQKQAEELGIRVLPMPFFINEKMYFEDITLTQEEFYKKLDEDADISTSQPSPADVMELWDGILKEYDEIIHIPMSSGLSSSCETAMALSQDYDGKVHVVDNQRISITQRQSVLDAVEMVNKGMSSQEIVDVLMREKLEASIYITVDTLKYLKKGGRVTA